MSTPAKIKRKRENEHVDGRNARGAVIALMELQDVQELTNFFERRVSSYQVAVQGEVAFDHPF
jgi:hypothetical protein